MSSFIEFTTIALVLVYIGVAAWKICTCRTISGSIGVSEGSSFSRWLTRWPPWCAGWPPLQSFWH